MSRYYQLSSDCSPVVRSRSSVPPIWSKAGARFWTNAALAASPYIRSRTNPVPRSLIRTVRGHGAPRRMGPICTPAFFQPWFSAATHPPWIGMSILSAIKTLVAVLW